MSVIISLYMSVMMKLGNHLVITCMEYRYLSGEIYNSDIGVGCSQKKLTILRLQLYIKKQGQLIEMKWYEWELLKITIVSCKKVIDMK